MHKELRIVNVAAMAIVTVVFFFPTLAQAAICLYETEEEERCDIIPTETESGAVVNVQEWCKTACDANDICKEGQNFRVEAARTTCPPQPVRLENPLSSDGPIDIPVFLGGVISRALTVVGAITLLVFIYGGFLWLTSAGREEKVKTGANAMLYAGIGLFIIFAAYGILNLVIQGLTGG